MTGFSKSSFKIPTLRDDQARIKLIGEIQNDRWVFRTEAYPLSRGMIDRIVTGRLPSQRSTAIAEAVDWMRKACKKQGLVIDVQELSTTANQIVRVITFRRPS